MDTQGGGTGAVVSSLLLLQLPLISPFSSFLSDVCCHSQPQQMFAVPRCDQFSSLGSRWGVLGFPPVELGAVQDEILLYYASFHTFSMICYVFF